MAPRRAAGDDGAADLTSERPPPDDDVAPATDPDPDLDDGDRGDPDVTSGDPGGGDGRSSSERPRRRSLLDAKTLALCALVAFLAAALAAVVADRVIGDGDDEPASEAPTADLRPAESVPDVTFERFDGTPVRLSDYAGQPVVVNFWGSWCIPCVEEMPDLQRVHEALGDQVAFLGVNVRDSPEAADAMVDRTGVTYDLARDPDGELGRALDVVSWPTTFLVDAEGTVVESVHKAVSAELLCDKVNQGLLQGQLTECV